MTQDGQKTAGQEVIISKWNQIIKFRHLATSHPTGKEDPHKAWLQFQQVVQIRLRPAYHLPVAYHPSQVLVSAL